MTEQCWQIAFCQNAVFIFRKIFPNLPRHARNKPVDVSFASSSIFAIFFRTALLYRCKRFFKHQQSFFVASCPPSLVAELLWPPSFYFLQAGVIPTLCFDITRLNRLSATSFYHGEHPPSAPVQVWPFITVHSGTIIAKTDLSRNPAGFIYGNKKDTQ